MNYGQLAFSDAIKKMQEDAGSRNSYDRMEKMSAVNGFTNNEITFIGER
ncbi:hypothetical protein [Flavobacterium sp. 1355]|jgi:hypothetical protein|nr:hypothetical protein [Flavobacterium sp. 1355]MBP1225938.1 hypothetical protein [Flavobacterium sp. 1355]